MLWCCWLACRKGIRPVKTEWWSVGLVICLGVQTCMWPSWCHCHSLSLASVKSRLVLPFWYRLTQVVLDKGPLNGCVSSSGLGWVIKKQFSAVSCSACSPCLALSFIAWLSHWGNNCISCFLKSVGFFVCFEASASCCRHWLMALHGHCSSWVLWHCLHSW